MASPEPGSGHPDPGGEPNSPEIAEIATELENLRHGETGALDRLTSLLYQELRQLARRRLRGERLVRTLGTTALVNEAYIRLASQRKLSPEDRSQFFAAASNTMRRVLIDYARARRRAKRGGGIDDIPIDEIEPFLSDHACEEMIELNAALSRLESAQPRAARVFEQRVFGGLSLAEVADVVGISIKTVQRDWDAARAWLRKEVRHSLDAADVDDRVDDQPPSRR
jgi:RNA polymerase sigma factor (TIGR02999 family)